MNGRALVSERKPSITRTTKCTSEPQMDGRALVPERKPSITRRTKCTREPQMDGRALAVRAQAIHHKVILPAVCISRDTLLSGYLAAISDTQLGNIRNQYISIEQQNLRVNHRWTGEPLCPSASHPSQDGRESPCVRPQAIQHKVILPGVCISRDTLLSCFLAAISDTQLGNIRNQYISIEEQNVRVNHRWTGEPLCPSASHPSHGNPTWSLHIT
ncbi:hypothetical protein J6590_028934 [Homalodisca vitripennis]|nr:hypothetical protein J6590_028934 [Homalodisca vitripennis]